MSRQRQVNRGKGEEQGWGEGVVWLVVKEEKERLVAALILSRPPAAVRPYRHSSSHHQAGPHLAFLCLWVEVCIDQNARKSVRIQSRLLNSKDVLSMLPLQLIVAHFSLP